MFTVSGEMFGVTGQTGLRQVDHSIDVGQQQQAIDRLSCLADRGIGSAYPTGCVRMCDVGVKYGPKHLNGGVFGVRITTE